MCVRQIEAKAICHGHSTPQMAGRFANDIGAKVLALNHFSARYKGDASAESVAVMQGIANDVRGRGGGCAAAWLCDCVCV